MKLHYAIIILVCAIPLYCQTLLWHKEYNGIGGLGAGILDATIDANINVYVTGYTSSHPTEDGYDITTIKYNKLGEELWRTTTDIFVHEQAHSICRDANGNVYIAGWSYDGSNYRLVVLKYNSSGVVIAHNWDEIQNAAYQASGKFKIVLDNSGNIYVSTQKGTDCWLISFTNNCSYRWQDILDFGGIDDLIDMIIDQYNNLVVVGRVETPIGQVMDKDIWVAKYNISDSPGYCIWSHKYQPDPEYATESCGDVVLDYAGNIYVAGTSNINSPYKHPIVLKYNSDGTLLWAYHYYDPQNRSCCPLDIVVNGNSGIPFITGWVYDTYTKENVLTMAVNSSGTNYLWKDEYGGSKIDEGYEVGITGAAVYVSGYYSTSDGSSSYPLTMCYNQETGHRNWAVTYDYGPNSNGKSWNVAVNQLGDYHYIVSAGGKQNPYATATLLYKFLGGNETPPGNEEPMFYTQMYPNPTNEIIRIRLSLPADQKVQVDLYSATGLLIDNIYNGFVNTGINEFSYKPKSLSAGVYFVSFRISNKQKIEKVIFQR